MTNNVDTSPSISSGQVDYNLKHTSLNTRQKKITIFYSNQLNLQLLSGKIKISICELIFIIQFSKIFRHCSSNKSPWGFLGLAYLKERNLLKFCTVMKSIECAQNENRRHKMKTEQYRNHPGAWDKGSTLCHIYMTYTNATRGSGSVKALF